MTTRWVAKYMLIRVGGGLSSRVCVWLCVLGGLTGCGLRDAFTAHSDTVAQAAGHELTVERLGQIIAASKNVPLHRDVVERMAGLWVDYTLLAQRLAAGDSLLDSARVVSTLWSEVQQQIVTHYHEELVTNNVVFGEQTVDSAYQAGNHRLIFHILILATPDMTDEERGEKRLRAERLREVAVSGNGGWARANQENEDSLSMVEGGSLGMIERGQTVPQFEQVAFSLEPGEVSSIVESGYGYHIVRRPALNEVRADYESRLRAVLVERVNFVFINEVQDRWEIGVRPEAPELMREAAEDPVRFRQSRKVIGSYLNSDFRVSDFARWLQALPAEYTAEVIASDDDQLDLFAHGLIRNDVLEIEARDAGHGLSAEDYAILHETLSQDLVRLRRAMALDSAMAAGDPANRFEKVDTVVDNYLRAVTNNVAQLVTVPAFLAESLRSEMEWEVSSSGVNRALERGARLRAGLGGAAETVSPSDSIPANQGDR